MSYRISPSRLDSCAACGTGVQRTRTSAEHIYCRDCRNAGKAPSRAKHGTHRRYRLGCRCDACRDTNNRNSRKYQAAARARGYERPDRPRRPEVMCVECGQPLLRRAPGAMTHKACRTPMRWANEIQISRGDRLAIYERDGWTCQLCGDPVDPNLNTQERMGATLDHIVPRSLTLTPDDSPENLRLAHRACNSARGNRAT